MVKLCEVSLWLLLAAITAPTLIGASKADMRSYAGAPRKSLTVQPGMASARQEADCFGEAEGDSTSALWRLHPVRDGVAFCAALALLLLMGFVRRRVRRRLPTDAYVEVPDYLHPQRTISVPLDQLRDDPPRPFYAVRLGRLTLIVKIYWRHVHF